MKLKTLEDYIEKSEYLWDSKDINKLIHRYGKENVLYETPGITNINVKVFKYRDMAGNDEIILNFINRKNKEYSYVLDYINDYMESIDYLFWSLEKPLQIIYKILCERLIREEKPEDVGEHLNKLDTLIENMKYQRIKNIKEEV